jgi:hypothetical protein
MAYVVAVVARVGADLLLPGVKNGTSLVASLAVVEARADRVLVFPDEVVDVGVGGMPLIRPGRFGGGALTSFLSEQSAVTRGTASATNKTMADRSAPVRAPTSRTGGLMVGPSRLLENRL